MKSAIRYEFKRILLPLVVFLACAAVIAVAYCAIVQLESLSGRLYDSALGVHCAILCILATVVPVLQFSYRMKQRSVDLWYSLPITRKQLTLVRILGGLVLTLAPFALGYWLGVAVVAIRGAHFDYFWYLPAFFALLLAGTALFLVNAFFFTRGNSVFDGIFFMLLWCCLLPVVFASINLNLAYDNYYLYNFGDNRINFDTIGTFLFSYSPAVLLTNVFSDFVLKEPFDSLSFSFLTSGGELEGEIILIAALILPVIEGVLAYFGLTRFAERDKAENASQVSSSWWGYKTLIPAYALLVTGIVTTTTVINAFEFDFIFFFYLALIAVGAFVLYFVYRHSFRLKKSDILSVVFSMLGGIAYAYMLYGIYRLIW